MLSTLKSAVKAEDTRKKILFTLMMFLVFRIGAHIPVPNIDVAAIAELTEKAKLLGFFDMVSGGAFKNFSIFAMSITPYINASIIMQLLTVIVPRLEQLAKEGRIYLVSPSVPMKISRLEKDMEKLGHLYARGYKDAKDQMEQLKAYLGMK